MEYWLISAPGDKTCQQTWETLQAATRKHGDLSTNYKFQIPDLKVGTLDSLVGLSDDLTKQDSYVEQIMRKLAHYLGDVMEGQRDKLAENLTANGKQLSQYVGEFQWDMAKYPTKLSLKNIADIISRQVTQIESDLKTKSQQYNSLSTSLQNIERKQTGSLLTRNIGDLVRKEHFILNSEYLTTLLVVVPKMSFGDWQSRYETLTDMIVPRSSQLIHEDQDHGLFNVTLFKKAVDDFKQKARESRFIVRDFSYNEEELMAGNNEYSKLASEKKKQVGPLVRWLRVNFSECAIAWMHVKALRVFVESVLRYGLPVNFQAMLLQPQKKSQRRLRDMLNHLYSHLDTTAANDSDKHEVMDIPGLGFGTSEYYPYVYFRINSDMTERM